MNNQPSNESEFIITLTIDGTKYEEVEVNISNMDKSLKEQINKIVEVFELPKTNGSGEPIQYQLGRAQNGNEESEIFELEDEKGREQCFRDYKIKPGDHLHLFRDPIAG